MSFNSEYQALRKKRKKQEEENQTKAVSDIPIKTSVMDLAPIRVQTTTKSPYKATDQGKSEGERTWFKKGAFEDGYDFGDITKTILGTAGDVGVNLLGSLGDISEGLLNVGASAVGGVAGLLGNDKLQKETEYFIKEDKVYGADDVTDFAEILTGSNVDEMSVLGEKSDSVVQSGGQLLTASALQTIGVPWWVTMGTTSFGGKMNEALNEGATYNEALVSSAISTGAELLTEKLSGGVKFGGKALDDVFTRKLATGISNKFVRTAVKLGMDVTGEGAEEVLSQGISNFGDWLTYRDDEKLEEVLASEEAVDGYIEAFIGGGLIGGIAGGVKSGVSAKRGVDYTSQLTANEEKVINSIYENRIKESETDGKKVTQREKNKIYDDVIRDLEKGYISTDTIESVLGGDTYQEYKKGLDREASLKKEEESLREEFNTLNRMENGKMTGEQVDRREELRTRLKELKSQIAQEQNNEAKAELKSRLSTEVSELAKADRLSESYNEIERRKTAFEADLSKYSAKEQETVQRAIQSGILNNTNRTHDFVDMVAKLSAEKGVLFDFTNNEKLKESGLALDGVSVNGYIQGNNIAVNIDSAKALNTVVGHEITHILEGTELYTAFADTLKQYATTKGIYDAKLQSIAKLYENVEGADINAEVTADLVGEFLFTDSEFINRLSAEQPNIFKKIFNEIKYLCRVATAGSKEARQLEKVKKAFEDVYRQKNNTDTENDGESSTNIKFSLDFDKYPYNMQTVIKEYIKSVDKKLLDMVEETKNEDKTTFKRYTIGNVSQKLKDDIMNQLNIDVTNYVNAVNSNAIKHIITRHGENGKSDNSMSNSQDIARMGYVVENYDTFEVLTDQNGNIEYSEEFRNADDTKAPMIRLSKKINGTYYVVNAVPEGKYKKIWVVSAYISKGSDVTQAPNNSGSYLTSPSSANTNISQENYGVNNNSTQNNKKYSLSEDSEGNKLSNEQIKRYRNVAPELRDKKGRIKPFYHGTARADRVGYYFDPERATSGPMAYFTDNAKIAENYSKDKSDTSMAYDSDYDSYDTQFQINGKPIANYWYTLSPKEKNELTEKIKQVTLNDDDSIILDPDNKYGIGNFNEYELKMARGNAIKVLLDGWLNDGTLYREESRFLEVLETIGIKNAEYKDPNYREEKVYKVYLNITNPFNTNDIDEKFVADLENYVASTDMSKFYTENSQADMWDKHGIDIYDWIERLKNDVAKGTTHAWTSIPDVVTEFLKEYGGYDGIVDNGGKNGGKIHTVVIPFYPNQIKNVDNVNPTDSEDIRFSLGGEDIAPGGDYRVYGRDIALAPTAEDIARMKEDTIPEGFAPTAENIARLEEKSVPKAKEIDGPVRDDIKNVENMGFTLIDDTATEQENTAEIDTDAVKQLTSSVISDLGIGKGRGNRRAVSKIINELGNNPSLTKEDIFNAVSNEFGTQYIEEVNDEIVETKDYLKNIKINVSDSIKNEFGSPKDYLNFVRRNFGKIRFSKDGRAVEQVYMELNEMFPHLFPSDVANESDQLRSIAEVAGRPKSVLLPEQLDEDSLRNAAELIFDSVNEYREAEKAYKELAPEIDGADISEKSKERIKNELIKANKKIDTDFSYEKNSLIDEFNARRETLESEVADKNVYFSKKAANLYNELIKLKKGVRASEDLGYLLDSLDSKNWATLKAALVNVRNYPGRVVNADSAIEGVVREMLEEQYNSDVYELDNIDASLDEEMTKLKEKADEKRKSAKLAVNGKLARERIDGEVVGLMGDTSFWKDKRLGISYKTNTERRNFRDIVKDRNGKPLYKVADALYDYFMGTYNRNEASLNREANKVRQEYAKLKLNKYEDAFVQIKGEFLHNPHSELTQHDVDTFLKLHGKHIDEAKVDKTIDMARKTYDSLFERMNDVLVAHGMKPIEYRSGYFPHFSEPKQSAFAKMLNWKIQNNEIPTDIAGLTESFKPNRSWQSFNKKRISDETDYSFTKGFDRYLQGSLDWIYHIDDIMKRRVFENRIRYDHSDEGVKAKVDEIYKSSEYDSNEKQNQIDMVFREAGNPLNNFIQDFRARTNTLAGKKSSMDRGMEEITSRKFYSTMSNLSNKITGNMVAGSVSSALTNFIPITQSWLQVSPKSSLIAMTEVMRNAYSDDGTVNKSDFLTNRLRKSENLHQTGWDKASKAVTWLMEGVDNFTSQTVWRSKYNENISKGMSEAEAIKNADQFAENVLAGRSRGNMPTVFDSKNPLLKIATAFQLEVNNQYGYMFKDAPQDMKNESKAKLLKGYATMFIGAYAYNMLYSALTGRDAAFDPIGIVEELLKDLGILGDDEDEEKEIDVPETAMNLFDNILEEMPFVSGLVGGGRIPLSSALPYGDNIRDSIEGNITDISEGDWENLTKEWLGSAGAYVLAPIGGGQLRKTVQGLGMFDDDLPIAGSYTDNGKLRFTVKDDLPHKIQSAVFGQYSSSTARQYFDEGRSPLNEKQMKELIELDIPIEKYWEYKDGLKALGKDATFEEKAEYIANLEGYSTEQKNIMVNNLTSRKTPVDLTDYDMYGNIEELDYATKNPEKYAVAKSVGGYGSYKTYSKELSSIKSDKDENGKTVSGSRKEKVLSYINNLDAEFGEKIILFKSEYPSDDTYNYEIIEYLNERDDISREEMETILKELGFDVYPDGTVKW